MLAPRIMKAWRCEYGGYDEIVHAATASKARAQRWRNLSDCCPDIRFQDIRVTRAAAHDVRLPNELAICAQLSHEERHRILHAYGFSNRPSDPKSWGYRDHYCTAPDCEVMAHLVTLGLFRGPYGVDDKGGTRGWVGAFWYLTDAGKEAARSMIPLYGERIAA